MTDGAIERDDNGHMIIYIRTHSPFRFANELNERLGLLLLELTSQDSVLSTTDASPTTFRRNTVVTVPEGETFPNLLEGDELVLLRNLTCNSTTLARGSLKQNRFVGHFMQRYEYLDLPNVGDMLSIEAVGTFEVVLA